MRVVQLPAIAFAAAFVAAFAAVSAVSPAHAQQRGRILGEVLQAGTEAPLAGANVALEGTERGTATDADGMFAIGGLEPARYTIVVSAVGYERARRSIRVRSGETARLNIRLSASTAELSEVVVQARRGGYVAENVSALNKTGAPLLETPQSISVLTQTQMEARDVDGLGEALRYTPGVQGETFGFEPRLPFLRFRGFDATTTGLFRDGMQLRNVNFAISYNPEPYGSERIEVARGPASVLYGAGNPGGLVNFVSKKPTRQTQGEVAFEAGRFNLFEGRLDASGPVSEDGTFLYRLTGLVRESDTQIDYVNNDRIFVAPAVTWMPSESLSLTVLGRYQNDDARASQRLPTAGTIEDAPFDEIPVSRFLGEPGVDRYEREQWSAGYFFDWGINETFRVRQKLRYYSVDLADVSLYGGALQDDDGVIDGTIGRNYFASLGELGGLTVDNQALADVATGPAEHTFLLGVDYQNLGTDLAQDFGAGPTINVANPEYGADAPEAAQITNGGTDQYQVGVYLQDQVTLFDNLIATLNGRFDWANTATVNNIDSSRTEQSDQAFSGRAGLVYRSEIGLAPYASFSSSFLPAIGTDVDGNAFEPERGRQFEIGAKYQPTGANAFVTVALFDLTRRNFVQNDPETFQPFQTGEANSQGIEVEGVAGLDFGLDLTASFTYQDVEITESNVEAEVGERPLQVRETMAALWADYTVEDGPLNGLGLGAGGRYIGPSYGNIPNTLEAPSVTLFDATAHYDLGDFRLRVNVDNVFDNEYAASTFVSGGQDFISYGPERTYSLSLSYRW